MEESKNMKYFSTFHLFAEEPPFELMPEQIVNIKKAFDIYDFEHTGSIEVRKMRLAMLHLGIEPEAEEIQCLMEVFDKSNTGRVAFNTFFLFIWAKMAEEEQGYDFVGSLFSLYSGKMSFEYCINAVKKLGLVISDEDLQDIINVANFDDDDDDDVDDDDDDGDLGLVNLFKEAKEDQKDF